MCPAKRLVGEQDRWPVDSVRLHLLLRQAVRVIHLRDPPASLKGIQDEIKHLTVVEQGGDGAYVEQDRDPMPLPPSEQGGGG